MSQEKKLSAEEKISLITRNLQEVLGEDKIREIVAQRDLKVYWGTAPTGAPHVGYFVPMSKIGDLLRAGCEVTILFADLHAFLDNMKSSWEVLKYRMAYYEFVIKGMLEAIGVPIEKLKFIRGTDYQLTREYTLDVYRMASVVTSNQAQRAGAEVVKQVESPLLSGLLYPGLQALDEHYLGVDAQFGGVDQRKIFIFAEKFMPALGYKKCIHLMNPMVPAISGGGAKMSASGSKIAILDPPSAVEEKIRDAYCPPGSPSAVADNGILSFIKMVLFAVSPPPFILERQAAHGGNMSFNTYQELEQAYVEGKIFPLDLKQNVAKKLNAILAPIRQKFEASPELQEIARLAYPPNSEAHAKPVVVDDDDDVESKEPVQLVVACSSFAAPAPAAVKKAPKGARAEDMSSAELKVGQVVTAVLHSNKAHLMVLSVDIGGKNVSVVGGFAEMLSVDQVKGSRVVLLTNLQPSNFQGVPSEAVVLGAFDEKNKKVELLQPPVDSKVGDVVSIEGFSTLSPPPLDRDQAKKVLPKLWQHTRVDENGIAVYTKGDKPVPLLTSKGPVTVPTLRNLPFK